MPTSVKDMLAAAHAAVPRLGPEQVRARLAQGNAVLLDVRDPTELAGGKIQGAIAVSRGMLEFRADPASPSRHPGLRPDAAVLIYCASGGRAALAGKTLQELGYTEVRNAGGFKELAEAGLPVEPA
jgi:rhodanese-related sulfurtransferase